MVPGSILLQVKSTQKQDSYCHYSCIKTTLTKSVQEFLVCTYDEQLQCLLFLLTAWGGVGGTLL